jgi:hypothetical protein
MFFEFARGNSLRMIDESRLAFHLDERFENALRSTAMAWRQAVDRRLRRLGVNRVGWLTITAAKDKQLTGKKDLRRTTG